MVAKGQIKLNGCVFNTTASFEHIGSAAGVGTGGNTFNGVTTLKNTGTTALRLGGTNSDTFNDDVYIINSSAMVGSGSLQLSYGATSYFNGNLIVSSTTVFGISFSGAGSGSSVLDTGKTITIGSAGFGGTLLLRNFTQLHSTAQSMTLSGALNLVNSTFNGPLTCTSGNLLLSGNNFHGTTSFTKTGPSSDYSAGGNHFFQSVTVSNNTTNSAIVRFAATSGDIYHNDVALNTNTGFIQLAYSDTNEFKGDLTINSSKVTFNNGNGILQCTGGNTQEFGGNAPFVVGKLWMNKSTSTLILQRAVTIDSLLTLTSGIVYADSTNLLTLKAGGATSGASDLSFIDGPMKKIGNTAFVFPIGNSGFHSPIKIGNSSSATNAFYARNYHLEPAYSEFSDSSIDFVNPCEFWELKQIIGSDSISLGIAHDSSRCLYSNSGNSTVLRQLINNWVDIGNSFDTLGFLNSIYKQTGSIIITSGLKSLFKNRISLLDNYAVIGKNSVQSDRDIRIDGNICSLGSISNVILSSDSVFSIGACAFTVSCSDSLIEMIRNFKGKNLNALINGNSFTHGIYYSSTSIHLDSTVHLIGDSNSKFIFIANDSIIFGGMASINFGNVKPYNVVWVSNLGTRISTPVYLSGLFFSKESIIIEDRVIFKGVSSLRYDSYFYDLNITSPIKFKEAINNTSATNLPICPNIINDGFTSGSNSASAGTRVVVSENGDTYVAGYYRGILTFGNTTISNLNPALLSRGTFVAKYDDCGNLIWVTGPTGFYSGGPTGITIDENRGILYVLGQYIGANTGSNMNFGSCATCSIIGNDINGVYLVAYDIASGNALWAKTINATYGANSYNAVVDHSGNLNINFAWFLNGGSNGAIGTVDGSSIPPPLNPLSASHHIAQFDPNGTLSWINLIDGNLFLNRNNPRQGLAVDNQNNIYVAGIFGDFLNAGPVNLTTPSLYDIDLFFYSCGQNGSFRWVNQIGSQSVPNFGYELEGTNHLIVDNENNVVLYTSLLTNAFIPNSPLSLQGVTLTNSGLLDSYLLKFDINGNLIYNTGQAWITNFFGSGPNDRVTIGRFVQDQGQNDYYTLLGYKLAGNLVSVNDCIGCLTSTNTAQNTSPFLTRIDKSGVLSLATTLGNNNGAGWNDLGTSMGGYYKVTGGFVGNMTYLNTSLTSSLPTNQNMSLIVNQIPVINTSNNSNAQCVDFPITLSTNPGVSYLWSTGETSSTIVAENSGTYSVTITQYCGCTSTASIVLHGIYVEPLVTQQISCINSTGAAQINIINGTGPFTYLWNPGGITTNSINNLSTGTYFCTVTDVSGCSVTTSINIGNYINGVPITLKGDIYECSSDDIYSVVNPIPGVPYSYIIIDNNGSTVSNTGSSVTISQGSVALPFTVTFYSYAGTQCEKSASLDVYPCCYGSINADEPGSTLTFTDIKASDLLTLPNLSLYFTGGNTLTLNQTTSLTDAIAINGTFTVDMDFNFASCHILMGPNSKIVVESPYLLTCVNRVYFHSCGSYMWKGIHLESGGANMKGIDWYIEDAKTALFVGTGSNYLFQDTYFNKNWVAIDLEADMDKISNLTSCTIECVDQLFSPSTFYLNPTPIPSTIQLPPHVNQRSFIGIDVKDVVDDINSATTYVGLQIGAESWPNNIGGNNPYLGCNPCSSNTFYHLDIAIRGVNSDMLIINNNFKGIDNASNPVAEGTHLHLQPGTAILSNHSNRPEPNKLYIGTDNNGAFNTLYKNTFEDGKRGVLLLNNVNGIIKFNTFTGMTGSGVQLRSGINQDLEILNNTFIDCSRGCFCVMPPI
ncbi:MAG: hypothetical protein IPM91_07205 [Bacteroidetes bacterium]|nr:hypothetical protein [Bacteroidota bacterium]